VNCPHCQMQNPRGARFCLNCGTALVQRCPSCQIELPGGARFCLNCGQPIVLRTRADDARLNRLAAAAPVQLVQKVRAAARLAGERRTVTALFVDVVGSTTLAQQVDAADWSAILNGALDRCSPAIYRYEGTIAHLLGDELLAFFGAPVAHEDDPVRAVRAALDLLEAMRLYAQDVCQQHGVEFAVRVSLSTGPVIVGPIDGDLHYEYSALGGGVNLAARVELLKRPMAVLISEETYSYVAPFFEVADLGLVQVDDPVAAVHVYQVLGPRPVPGLEPGRLAEPARLESPLVGRETELATLLQLGQTVRAGLGRAVLITGEPGIGKSRLIAEWHSTAAATNGAALRWAQAQCLSYSREFAYNLLADLLHSLIGVPAGADEPQMRAALLALTQELFGWAEPPGEGAAERGHKVYAALGHLLSLKLEDWALEQVQHLTPEALRALYLTALRQLLQALAAREPLVLILENLHWADPSSIDLLVHLLPLATGAPLLFALVTRPDRDAPGWQLVVAAREILGGTLSEIALGALPRAKSRQLVVNLLGQEAVPESIQVPIQRKAEGNPLFVEEVIRMLIEQKAIRQTAEGWVAEAALDSTDIPNSLQRLLQARIDRLPGEIETTLRVASVIGRRFPVRVLERVLDGQEDGAELVNHLSRLESAGLVRVDQTAPELVYRFRNVLMQDAAYSSLLASDRQRLHLAVGQALEALYPEQLASRELAPTLARHFDRGQAASRAYHYARLAGNAALGSYANREAEQHYRRALELADAAVPPSGRAELLLGLGESLYRQSCYKDAIQTWRQGIALYVDAGDSDGVARLYARSARAAWYDGDPAMSLSLCQEGLAAVSGAPDSPGIALLVHEAGRAHFFNQSSSDEVRPLLERALDMAGRLEDVAVQADALATLGLLHDMDPHNAVDALREAVDLAEGAGLLAHARRAHNNLAALLQERLADFAGAREHYERAAELSQRSGSIEGEIIALSNMASAALWTGEFDKVEATFAARRQLFREAANPGPAEAGLRISEASLLRYQGALQEAARLLEFCQQEARQQQTDAHLLQSITLWASIVLEAGVPPDSALPDSVPPGGDGAAGWEAVEALLKEAAEVGDRVWADGGVWPRCLLGALYARLHRFKEAHYVLAEAREVAHAWCTPLDEGWLSWAEARVAAAEGRWGEALAAFESAARRHARLGVRWWWARALQEWAEAHGARGEPADLERARALLREAQALYEELGTPYYARQVESRLQILNAAIHAEMVARHQVVQELAAARQIQESFLPEALPHLDGWQLAVTLTPAREVSGDFYDMIPLPNGRWGLLVADVADKGLGAALYMALCRTLMRTYAGEFGVQPEMVLSAVNARILSETHRSMFVTMFYAVLDPLTSTLTYCNAGHTPPHIFRIRRGLRNAVVAQSLGRTGMALGVVSDAAWEQDTVQMTTGDVLVIYSDGVTEAHNPENALLGNERAMQAVQARVTEWATAVGPMIQELTAQEVLDALVAEVREFVDGAPQSDDITVMVLMRTG
jgi:serine phosphatase RsbU (regulator of sigma subunit)/class 3 adenylate cyclase